MRLATAAAAALLVASCASGSEPSTAPPPVAQRPAAPAPAAPPPGRVASAAPPRISLPVAPISIPPLPPPDQCGAYELQWLVGRSRTEIPIPVQPNRRRVVCDSCPRTLDFRPDRLTIEYDADNGRVTKLSCG